MPYELPPSLEAYNRLNKLRIIGDHKIKEIWEDDLAFKVHAIENKVEWTSTNIIHIGYIEEFSSNVILWIGVKPDSLSYEQGIDVALQQRQY